jgi:glucose-1-phosphate cytidylyltransferase
VQRPSQFGVPMLNGSQVTRFAEKPTTDSDIINGGFFALEPRVLDYIDDDATSFESESLGRLAEAGELMAFRHEGFWQPMDTLRDVRKLNSLWADGNPQWKVWRE